MNKTGFGFLRLPMQDGEVDYTALDPLVDFFMEHGGYYFDTAYTYLNGKSEEAIRKAVVERKPRESFWIVDKLPGYKCKAKEDCNVYFEEQRKRCGVEYFDVFMLHWLNDTNYRIAEECGEFAFLQELKESGRAKRIGFSYHDSAALLDEILTAHPQVDYVQLQINYLDWESPSIQARQCYETAVKHGKKVIVMEPVKGGTLAKVPKEVEQLLKTFEPEESIASHAIRFVQSLPQVEICLSGMNEMAQMVDNMRDFTPISQEHKALLAKAAAMLKSSITVPCTGCGYCLKGCPKGIAIPRYFALYNDIMRTPAEGWKIRPVFDRLIKEHGAPADCIRCRACERSCPQKLPITDHLARAAEALGPQKKD
ncbi:MAG: aldo/keto reductase [Firmicutes bacterium]|nr:aldo/keto reductase [Bacillota bacterium]